MTPTLIGRWQSRTVVLLTVGVVITFIFGMLYADMGTPFALLLYVLVLGFGWDVLYRLLQVPRWDSDWSPIFAIAGGVIEGLFLWLLIQAADLPGIADGLPFWKFAPHYGTVLIAMLVMLLGGLKILFPQWRFHGGKITG